MALVYGQQTITTGQAIPLSPATFSVLTVLNNDPTNIVFIGFDTNVTAAIGYPIPPNTSFTFDFSDVAGAVIYWGIASGGSVDVRFFGRT